MFNNYNPYFGRQNMPIYQQPIEQIPNQQLNTPQYSSNQVMNKPFTLLGKSVDSIEVVKATDIPLDGSVSYFPLTDGSAIITKQLRADGTSKTIMYKPVDETKEQLKPNYVTIEELDEKLKEIDLSDIDDIKEEIRDIRKQLKDIKK